MKFFRAIVSQIARNGIGDFVVAKRQKLVCERDCDCRNSNVYSVPENFVKAYLPCAEHVINRLSAENRDKQSCACRNERAKETYNDVEFIRFHVGKYAF